MGKNILTIIPMAGKPTNSIQVSYTSLPDGMIPINSKPIIGNEQSISPLLNCFDNFIENLGTDELARYKKPLYIIINLATILSSRTLKNKKIRRFTGKIAAVFYTIGVYFGIPIYGAETLFYNLFFNNHIKIITTSMSFILARNEFSSFRCELHNKSPFEIS